MLSKTIAIVDDEADLVTLFSEILKMNGYDTCTFTDPLKALNDIGNNPNKYHLIISDFRMPNMNGNELCNKLVNLNPNLKIVIMSAYENVEYNPNFKFISKPIPLPRLLQIVRENLIATPMM